jgi:NhaP-type Na+/H+ or K+/H+ antiporter
MYQNAALLALFLLVYSAVAGRVERSWISGPIVFTSAGLLLGPVGLDILHLNVTTEGLRILAELTLAMVLFTDAANADLATIRYHVNLPGRLLLIGLPLTIVLGFLLAEVMFPWLDVLEMALLAAILAPTDAALGKPVVTSREVPAPIREGLNLESGLNDGLCVPVVVILLGMAAVSTRTEGGTMMHMARVVTEEIGIGLVIGLALTGCAALMLRLAGNHGWMGANWLEVPVVALAAACFAAAQAMGGSGFIACFVGGLMLNQLRGSVGAPVMEGAESVGETLALLTWIVFGAAVIGPMIGRFTWAALLYAVLSLTVIRMLPVYLCLSRTGMSMAEKLFMGWFGPRGLASIVFAIIVFNARLPGNDTVLPVIVITVLLSVVTHGVTANFLLRSMRFGDPVPVRRDNPESGADAG